MSKVLLTCVSCGKAFEVWPNRAESAKTCSQECRGKLIAKSYQEERPSRVCEMCGKAFTFPKAHEDRRRFCSRACHGKFDRQRLVATGSDHGNWKGGQTVHGAGYVYLYVVNHPFVWQGKYVFQHRVVMEEWMREEASQHPFLVEVDGVLYLRPEIQVHHKNLGRQDNRRRNLLACTARSHSRIHSGLPPIEGETWPEVTGSVPYEPSRVECTCEFCGAEFVKKRADVARGGGRFCSRDCYNKRQRTPFPT